MKVKSLKAVEILDSRGMPTLEVFLQTEKGEFKASCPSGTSQGENEAVELRDGGERYFGMGVLKAVENVNSQIFNALKGKAFDSIKKIDDVLIGLDGTENKSNLGANAMLSVSIAALRALAFENKKELYEYIKDISRYRNIEFRENAKKDISRFRDIEFRENAKKDISKYRDIETSSGELEVASSKYRNVEISKSILGCFNILNGGKHAGNDLKIQEFMIIPMGERFDENYRMAAEVYQTLRKSLLEKFGSSAINVGYEGGFAPSLNNTKEVLNIIMEAIKNAGYENKIKLGLDVAASEFYNKNGLYNFEREGATAGEMSVFYKEILGSYPIIYLEDPFAENDFDAWASFKQEIKDNLILIGDDLLCTNPKRINMAKEMGLCNGIILKPNQIGTVSESLEAFGLARDFGWETIVSHRSGDTEDSFIADLAVGIGANFIKSGAPSRGERVAKYNRLQEIFRDVEFRVKIQGDI